MAGIGAAAIVALMFLVSHSIDILLGVLRRHPRAGEFTGYVTNGPEALVVAVGLIHGKLLFAAGVPLGSNFANPVLLTLAAFITGRFLNLFSTRALWTAIILLGTMAASGSFYLPAVQEQLLFWAIATLVISITFYIFKGVEEGGNDDDETYPVYYVIPAIALLLGAGYFLDPAVAMTAASSKVPEGAISFFVLSFITSWPEFRSVMTLIRMNRFRSALINIFVSNITNLWLAVAAVLVYLFS